MDTIASVDAELIKVHEKFLRADRRGDVAEAADLWNQLDDLLDRRVHIPLQHTLAEERTSS